MPALTQVPLPTLRNLLACLMNDAMPDSKLSAPWRRFGDEAFWFSRSAWSLLAIAKLRQRLTGQPCIIVWLPDFFCNSSLFPLRSTGARLEFYPLTDQMTPDLDACRTLADETRPDLFVLVHFFGEPTPADGAAKVCIDTGAWLIEDAAHVLQPITGIGEYGDCVLYSPHKHLPIPDGALLVIRENGPAKLATQPSALSILKEDCHALFNAPGFSNRPAWFWLTKRVLQLMGVRSLRQPSAHFLTDSDTPNTGLAHPQMSALARRLLSRLLDSLDTVAHMRRQNKLLWELLLSETKSIQAAIWSTSDDVTPYLAGFTFDDKTLAAKAFCQWQRIGLPVTTWPDLPPETLEQKYRHRNALLLRQTRIYLPVHQSLDRRQITDCVRKVQYG